MKKLVKCSSFNCSTKFRAYPQIYANPKFVFCSKCKSKQGYKVLVVQARFKRPIKDVLTIALRQYREPPLMADFLGISLPTLYTWVKKFFGVKSFHKFKRNELCGNMSCVSLSKEEVDPKVRYLLSLKLKSKGFCACSIMGQGVVLTTAPMSDIKSVLSGIKSLL